MLGPTVKITNDDQDNLNVDPTAGKSINAIRSFAGKGTLVWGGRTLAGNDNEWRYVNVRRLFNMIEESTRKATRLRGLRGQRRDDLAEGEGDDRQLPVRPLGAGRAWPGRPPRRPTTSSSGWARP